MDKIELITVAKLVEQSFTEPNFRVPIDLARKKRTPQSSPQAGFEPLNVKLVIDCSTNFATVVSFILSLSFS
jgi:hypothetical protein